MLNSLRNRLTSGDVVSWCRGAWFLLAFLQPFNQFGGLRWLTLTVLTVTLAILAVRKIRLSGGWYPTTWSVRIGWLLVGWIALASLIGPYPAESLGAMRQSLLVQVMMFAAGLVLVRSVEDAWGLVLASVFGFALLNILSMGDLIALMSARGLGDRSYSHNSWLGSYGGKGGYYLPLLLGWLITRAHGRWLQIGGTISLVASILLVALYGSRSPLIVGSVGVVALIFFLYGYRSFIFGAMVTMVLLGAILFSPLGKVFHYDSLLTPVTYATNQGLSQRLSIWDGMWQVIQVRPLIGYGYGWKKLAWVINEQGFVERWQSRDDLASYFFNGKSKASYGRVNPHNYFLQVWFEIGAVGLLLVLAFWALVLKECSALLRRETPGPTRALAATSFAVLVAYLFVNLTNGHWVGGLANLSLSLAAAMMALSRLPRRETVVAQAVDSELPANR